MISMIVGLPRRAARRTSREFGAFRKHAWQRFHCATNREATPAFIVGCQRSGTTMLGEVLDRSRVTWVYHESDSAAFDDYRLRPPDVIARLISRSRAKAVIFKPLCDAQWTDHILDRHRNAKAIWIFRRYEDVVNSITRKWRDHPREIMRWIRDDDFERLAWRGERLSEEVKDLVTMLYQDHLGMDDGSALFWYIRNELLFRLNLNRDPRVLLIRYEDLVRQPTRYFSLIFDFIGCPFEDAFVSDVFPSSVQRNPRPDIDPRVAALCEAMTARLEEGYASQAEQARYV